MTFDLQKILNVLLVLLTICLGLLLGQLAADWIGQSLAPEQIVAEFDKAEPTRVKKHRLQDFNAITQRNLFDSAASPLTLNESAAAKTESKGLVPPSERSDLMLLGTVSGGDSPLAVIKSGKETEVYKVGDSLPGNLTLSSVKRDKAIVTSAAGKETVLELTVEKSNGGKTRGRTAAKLRTSATSAKIIELG